MAPSAYWAMPTKHPCTLIPFYSPRIHLHLLRFYSSHGEIFIGHLTYQSTHLWRGKVKWSSRGRPVAFLGEIANSTQIAPEARLEPCSLERWGNCATIQPGNDHIFHPHFYKMSMLHCPYGEMEDFLNWIALLKILLNYANDLWWVITGLHLNIVLWVKHLDLTVMWIRWIL